jgi:hypothetical protein
MQCFDHVNSHTIKWTYAVFCFMCSHMIRWTYAVFSSCQHIYDKADVCSVLFTRFCMTQRAYAVFCLCVHI